MNPSFSPILWRGTKHLHADIRGIPAANRAVFVAYAKPTYFNRFKRSLL